MFSFVPREMERWDGLDGKIDIAVLNQKALLPSFHIQGIFSAVFGAKTNIEKIFYSKQD